VGCPGAESLVHRHNPATDYVALPGQARAGIETMGLGKLLRDSPYGVEQLRRWLYDHELHLWGAKFMSCMLRGPSRGEEALYENVE
jgi:hypothetical protein